MIADGIGEETFLTGPVNGWGLWYPLRAGGGMMVRQPNHLRQWTRERGDRPPYLSGGQEGRPRPFSDSVRGAEATEVEL